MFTVEKFENAEKFTTKRKLLFICCLYYQDFPIFKKYAKQTLDLMVDAFRWKEMAKHCDNEEMKAKYMQVSETLYNMFMVEHNNIGNKFREE